MGTNELHGLYESYMQVYSHWVCGEDLDYITSEGIDEISEAFKPTQYSQSYYDRHGIFGRSRKAQQIDRQVQKLKASGKKHAGEALRILNTTFDRPDYRKASIEKSRQNIAKSDARARRDAQRDEKESRKNLLKNSYDYETNDLILGYLINEGFADTEANAEALVDVMSEQ
jgi:hypothetical protein